YQKVKALSWLFAMAGLSHFMIVFAGRKRLFKNPLSYLVIYLPALFVGFLIFTSKRMIFEIMQYETGFHGIGGFLYRSFYLLLSIYFAATIYFCGRVVFGGFEQVKKAQARIMLIALIVPIFVGLPYRVVLPPLKGIGVISPFGPTILILVCCFAYAIVRYGQIKVTPEAAAEDIVKIMPDFLFLVTPGGAIAKFNPAGAQLIGKKADQVLGFPIANIFGREEDANFFLKRILKEGMVKNLDVELKAVDGNLIPVKVSGSVLKDEDGIEIGVVGVARDMRDIYRLIADLKHAKEILEERNKRLQKATIQILRADEDIRKKNLLIEKQLQEISELYRMKGDFTYIIANQLRSPLTAVKEGVKTVLQGEAGKITAEQKSYLNIVDRNIERLVRLIKDIIDFSSIDSGETKMAVLEGDIGAIVSKAVMDLGGMAKDKGLYLEDKIEPGLPTIMLDTDRIYRAVVNLLSNAIKLTDKGGVTILAKNNKEECCVRVCINDTSGGMPEDLLSKIFHPLGMSEMRDRGGAGLDFIVSKYIIEGHGGKISVKSMLGKGTNICFTLPY
ncbi:MAG: ATP-binding protein, partial [Candidatus Margulisiibacteriota bacterium]